MKTIGSIMVLGLILGGCSLGTDGTQDQASIPTPTPTPVAQENNNSFTYITYTKSTVTQAEASEKPYAIFWANKACGTCAKKESEIKSRMDELPEGTSILRAEFSEVSEAELSKYGVVKYDSFTVFDADGNFETIRGASVDDVAGKLVASL